MRAAEGTDRSSECTLHTTSPGRPSRRGEGEINLNATAIRVWLYYISFHNYNMRLYDCASSVGGIHFSPLSSLAASIGRFSVVLFLLLFMSLSCSYRSRRKINM